MQAEGFTITIRSMLDDKFVKVTVTYLKWMTWCCYPKFDCITNVSVSH